MLIFRVLARQLTRSTNPRLSFSTALAANMPKRASTEGGDAAPEVAKKAKADEENEAMDFSCDKKAPNGSTHNLKISAWNVAGLSVGEVMLVLCDFERRLIILRMSS